MFLLCNFLVAYLSFKSQLYTTNREINCHCASKNVNIYKSTLNSNDKLHNFLNFPQRGKKKQQ